MTGVYLYEVESTRSLDRQQQAHIVSSYYRDDAGDPSVLAPTSASVASYIVVPRQYDITVRAVCRWGEMAKRERQPGEDTHPEGASALNFAANEIADVIHRFFVNEVEN